jgi:hypothetical protein
LRQYLSVCTSKASKASTWIRCLESSGSGGGGGSSSSSSSRDSKHVCKLLLQLLLKTCGVALHSIYLLYWYKSSQQACRQAPAAAASESLRRVRVVLNLLALLGQKYKIMAQKKNLRPRRVLLLLLLLLLRMKLSPCCRAPQQPQALAATHAATHAARAFAASVS